MKKQFLIAVLIFLCGFVAVATFFRLIKSPDATEVSETIIGLNNQRSVLQMEVQQDVSTKNIIETIRTIVSNVLEGINDKILDSETKIAEIDEKVSMLVFGKKGTPGIPDVEAGNFMATDGGIDKFLSVNGAEFVHEAGDMFRSAGFLHNVKPELLVCIAQADSSLGKSLKTTNNIGNVGNTDSGAVKHYDSLGQAISAIASTLNNKYMKGLTMLGQLSQGGRNILETKYNCSNAPSPYKCYASSEYNWNRNVKLCLQDILQNPTINESWKFRN